MTATLITLRHQSCVVGLRIPPHLTKALALHNQEESNGASKIAEVKDTRYTENHLWLSSLFDIFVAPNVLELAGILPVIWIERTGPSKRCLNSFEVGDVFRVASIQWKEAVIRTCALFPNRRDKQPILFWELHS